MTLAVDSNVAFIATGQIGEAWAVVILEEIAKGHIEAAQSCLHLLELLDTYDHMNEGQLGKKMYAAMKRIIPTVIDVTVDDFLSAAQTPGVHPRENLVSKSMRRHDITKVFSVDGPTYTELEWVDLKKLLQQLNLPGNYIHERFKNKHHLS